jgi:hypothetical protein
MRANGLFGLPDLVRDIISGWKDSPTKFAQQAYGELSSLIWLTHQDLDWPAEMVRGILESESDSPMRVGRLTPPFTSGQIFPITKMLPY